MAPIPHTIAQDEEHLGALAMQFRGTSNQAKQKAIKKDYEQTVERLIKSGQWNDVPPPEDQLPDDWMPRVFFEYWSLG